MINWRQIAEDFRQRYEGTFCRYTSPYSKKQEIFQVLYVDREGHDEPPRITIHNKNNGELFLSYTTEAFLDFTFPSTGYFQHEDVALTFERVFTRQWKKGICSGTCCIRNPYSSIADVGQRYGVNEKTVASAFAPVTNISLSKAIEKLESKEFLSVALNKKMAIGLGDGKEFLLWYDDEPIAEVMDSRVKMANPLFEQEVRDFLRDTGDHGRAVV